MTYWRESRECTILLFNLSAHTPTTCSARGVGSICSHLQQPIPVSFFRISFSSLASDCGHGSITDSCEKRHLSIFRVHAFSRIMATIRTYTACGTFDSSRRQSFLSFFAELLVPLLALD